MYKNLEIIPFCRIYYRHGYIVLTRTVANDYERLRPRNPPEWNGNPCYVFVKKQENKQNKGPDNPTNQLLPIISLKGGPRDGEVSVKEWCVSMTWRSVKDPVSESCCVTRVVWKKICVKDGVWQSGVWNTVCQTWCLKKLRLKEGVWETLRYKYGVYVHGRLSRVVREKQCVNGCDYEIRNVKPGRRRSGVSKMVCERW